MTLKNRRLVQLTVAACGTLALVATSDAAPKGGKVPIPRPRPVLDQPFQVFSTNSLTILPAAFAATPVPTAALAYTEPGAVLPTAPTDNTPAADIAIIKQAAGLVRRDKFGEATALKASLRDPLARKFVEWMILRGDPNHTPGFERYAAFVAENPGWPSLGLLSSRAEAALWDDKRDAAVVLSYFAKTTPRTAKGRFALAKALIARGDKQAATRHVREAWRSENFSSAVERMALNIFPDMLQPVDHRIRMHRRLYAEDNAGGLHIAQRLTAADQAIAKAWAAVNRSAKNAKALLDAVPPGARDDPGYTFSLVRWLRRNDKPDEAAKVLLRAPRYAAELIEPDDWWIESRLVARALIEAGRHQTAYRVARDAAVPKKGNYRVDREFTAGWIALRFLKQPATSLRHFAAIAKRTYNPTALARAGYWQGRAAQALGRSGDAQAHYTNAARFRTTYYGQLAHARLGNADIAIPAVPALSSQRRAALSRVEVVRALNIVYAIDEPDLAIPIVADIATRIGDPEVLSAMADITQQNQDARATMLIGRAALNQGLALAHYAFPTIGVPRYTPIGPEVDASVLYSIVRQESAFKQNTMSHAKAMGLMQVVAGTGRYIARKFNVRFDPKRLRNDAAYNVQLGAAVLGNLISQYNGSYILAFVGYNAGPGRVRDWVARYGDPRDPKVDAVDWVEMIPFAETRNYVQRIMENMQVYRARFGRTHRLMIEADLHRGTTSN